MRFVESLSYQGRPLDERPERIILVSHIVLVAGFIAIGIRVLSSVVVVGAEPCTFQKCPKSLDGVDVGFAVCILNAMVDDGVIQWPWEAVVSRVFIRDQQGFVRLNLVPDESSKTVERELVGGLCGHLSAPLNGADNRHLVRSVAALVGLVVLPVVRWIQKIPEVRKKRYAAVMERMQFRSVFSERSINRGTKTAPS